MKLNRAMTVLAVALAVPGLQGCFPIIAGGMVATAMVVTDRRTSGMILEDQSIAVKITRQANIQYHDNSHVNVASYNRNVLLTGEAQTEDIRRDLETIARNTENVRGVVNALTVGPNSALSARASDTVLANKVRARFIAENKFSVNILTVVVESGVVYLLGLVTPQEGEDAATIASTTSGVLRVTKVFEFIEPGSKAAGGTGTSGGSVTAPTAAPTPAPASAAPAPEKAVATPPAPVTTLPATTTPLNR